jgi:hypothetical protein
MPAVEEPAAEAENDEKTLDELDNVPAVQTMVVSAADAEKLRAGGGAPLPAASEPKAPEERSRRRPLPILGFLLVVLAVAAIVAWSLWGR